MGVMSFFADRERKAELRESKDEMMVGERHVPDWRFFQLRCDRLRAN